MTKTLKRSARALLRGRRGQQRNLLLTTMLLAGVHALALLSALRAQFLPLSARLPIGAGLVLLAAGVRSFLLLKQTEEALFCATGTKPDARMKRFALLRLPLLLSLRLLLLLCVFAPAVLFLLVAFAAFEKSYPAVTVTLLFGCGGLLAAISRRFFLGAAAFLELVPHLLLSGVSFSKSVRCSVGTLSARKRAFFRLRRSFVPWRAASVLLLPLPFARRYYQLALTLFALSPDFS